MGLRWSVFCAYVVEAHEHIEAERQAREDSESPGASSRYRPEGYDPPSLRERLDIPWAGPGPDPRGGREGVSAVSADAVGGRSSSAVRTVGTGVQAAREAE